MNHQGSHHSLADDPRVAKARTLADELRQTTSHAQALSDERRRLLVELRAEGVNMSDLAQAVGVSRQWLYTITG